MKVHLLVESNMLPIPTSLASTVLDDACSIVDQRGCPLARGLHVLLDGPEAEVQTWLAPFDRVWVGEGPPQFQHFQMMHIRLPEPEHG